MPYRLCALGARRRRRPAIHATATQPRFLCITPIDRSYLQSYEELTGQGSKAAAAKKAESAPAPAPAAAAPTPAPAPAPPAPKPAPADVEKAVPAAPAFSLPKFEAPSFDFKARAACREQQGPRSAALACGHARWGKGAAAARAVEGGAVDRRSCAVERLIGAPACVSPHLQMPEMPKAAPAPEEKKAEAPKPAAVAPAPAPAAPKPAPPAPAPAAVDKAAAAAPAFSLPKFEAPSFDFKASGCAAGGVAASWGRPG